MTEPQPPQTWHHGLMARWWAEYNQPEPDELAYYRGAIERFGQPALDVGCGAGRILLPLVESGLDVDGVDLSADMLARTRDLAAARGLPEPRLFAQAMHELSLERTYRTVYICDSFGIGGSRAQDRQTLRRIRDLLEPGGGLVFSHYLPYDDTPPERWLRWLPGHRPTFPSPWPEEAERRPLPGGDELELRTRTFDFDPLLQQWTLEMRIRQLRGDAVVAEESRRLIENLYFAQELLDMLREAGFADVTVEGHYTGIPATRDDSAVVFVARRP